MAISDVLTNLLLARGENPHSLSLKCGVPQPTIARIASGESKEPRRGNLIKIARALGVKHEVFYGESATKQERIGAEYPLGNIEHNRRASDKNRLYLVDNRLEEIAPDEYILLQGYRDASDEHKEFLINAAKHATEKKRLFQSRSETQ
jgi:transcriptional regulator with XRE-family HTH domain